MPRRFKKRINHYRGTRRCGHGNIKNKRGKGNRGGRGYAGSNKHRWTYIIKYEPDHLGKHGFTSPKQKGKPLPVMNLWELGRLTDSEITFHGKVLGTGNINRPIKVKALAWSKKAEAKIKEAGGSIEKIE